MIAGALVMLVLAACGGASEVPQGEAPVTTASAVAPAESTMTPTSTSTPEAGSADPTGGKCAIVVTGEREGTWTFPQSIYSISSDYWMSEDELRETVEFLGEEIAGGSYDELVGRGEPVITFLSVGCANADNLIEGATVTHSNATLGFDLPMGPGSYPIVGGFFDADGPTATMIGEFSLADDELYNTVADSGSLEITRWDMEAIEGSFSFDAVEAFVDDPREIRVTVEFSYVCPGWFTGC